MRDELRKEIRSIIWKTLVDTRLNTLSKKKRELKEPLLKEEKPTGEVGSEEAKRELENFLVEEREWFKLAVNTLGEYIYNLGNLTERLNEERSEMEEEFSENIESPFRMRGIVNMKGLIGFLEKIGNWLSEAIEALKSFHKEFSSLRDVAEEWDEEFRKLWGKVGGKTEGKG